MLNNSLSFITVLSLSTALFVMPVGAQEVPVDMAPSEAGIAAPVEIDSAQKKALEAELSNTNINSAEILDFPGRTSLGDLEMATLPGINESIINGPSPMAPSVSTKDMPSEQLLGRITTEVFQEMADLERGNVFLKLQMQKEQLKNDLEKLKATYRQTRLEEISKREEVVRSRINWWQEQEDVRLEMEKKKAETEAVEQQIAEAEELRNKLRAEAIAEKEKAQADALSSDSSDSSDSADTKKKDVEAVKEEKVVRAVDTYSLIAVKGIKGNLTASLEQLDDGKVIQVKVQQTLPTGFVVEEITKDTIKLRSGEQTEVLMFNVVPASTNE